MLELRTSSLFPEESIQSLKKNFGERFDGLPELARVILATAETEGTVTHARIKTLTTEHPKDITAELMRLARDGFLEKHGETRAAAYAIPGRQATSFALELGLDGSTEATQPRPAKTTVETPMSVETTVETTVETPMSAETTVKTEARTPDLIVKVLSDNPAWTLQQVSEKIDKSIRTVEKATSKLVAEGRLRHVGPKKSGHWEVVE